MSESEYYRQDIREELRADIRAATDRVIRAITLATFFICFAADASLRAKVDGFIGGLWSALLDIIGLCWGLLDMLRADLGWTWGGIVGVGFLMFGFLAGVIEAIRKFQSWLDAKTLHTATRRQVEPPPSASARHGRIDPTP